MSISIYYYQTVHVNTRHLQFLSFDIEFIFSASRLLVYKEKGRRGKEMRGVEGGWEGEWENEEGREGGREREREREKERELNIEHFTI